MLLASAPDNRRHELKYVTCFSLDAHETIKSFVRCSEYFYYISQKSRSYTDIKYMHLSWKNLKKKIPYNFLNLTRIHATLKVSASVYRQPIISDDKD